MLIYITLGIILIASLIAAVLVGAGALVTLFYKVPFVPTPKKNVKKVMTALQLKPGEVFYDLGCGNGQFVREAAKYGARATGFEIAPWPYFRAWLKIHPYRQRANVHYQNFYQIPMGGADVIFCFLITAVMPKLEQKLLTELKPGARVVSYGFAMPSWQPKAVIETRPDDPKASKIYVYIKG